MMIGTPGYMSPEQIEGGEVDHRSDIFAVGAVCYELLAYTEAFAGANTRPDRAPRARGTAGAAGVAGARPRSRDRRDRPARAEEGSQQALSGRRDVREGARACARAGWAPDDAPAPPAADAAAAAERRRQVARGASRSRIPARARGVASTGSRDAARRFAVEALAEDPSHAGARAFLAGLEQRSRGRRDPGRVRARPTAAGEHRRSARRAGTSVGSAGPTAIGGSAGPRSVRPPPGSGRRSAAHRPAAGRVGASESDQTSTFASAPTIIVTPAAPKVAGGAKESVPGDVGQRPEEAAPTRAQVRRGKRAGRRLLAAQARRPSAARTDPVGVRYRWPLLVIGVCSW